MQNIITLNGYGRVVLGARFAGQVENMSICTNVEHYFLSIDHDGTFQIHDREPEKSPHGRRWISTGVSRNLYCLYHSTDLMKDWKTFCWKFSNSEIWQFQSVIREQQIRDVINPYLGPDEELEKKPLVLGNHMVLCDFEHVTTGFKFLADATDFDKWFNQSKFAWIAVDSDGDIYMYTHQPEIQSDDCWDDPIYEQGHETVQIGTLDIKSDPSNKWMKTCFRLEYHEYVNMVRIPAVRV